MATSQTKVGFREPQRELHYKEEDAFVAAVLTSKIRFPFQRGFMRSPAELFANLASRQTSQGNNAYSLRSYYPQYGLYEPPLFRGSPRTILADEYTLVDILSDFYMEEERLKARRYDQPFSTLQAWADPSALKAIFNCAVSLGYNLEEHLHKSTSTTSGHPTILRKAIYKSIPEAKVFNPSWAKGLLRAVFGLQGLTGKRWLDISAGWGDRLLTAMALDMEYTGFDPNNELKVGHDAMIQQFGSAEKHCVRYEPFEKATNIGTDYDVILSSPPYFMVEEYAPGQVGQSIVSYPDFSQWMAWFLFASLSKAWAALKPGGYLILHLGDPQAREMRMAEATNLFIETLLPGSSWEGVIGVESGARFPRPVWVWKKLAIHSINPELEPPDPKQVIWNPHWTTHSPRTLYKLYPQLMSEFVAYQAHRVNPNYGQRRSNAISIRSRIADQHPTVDRQTISLLFQDDSMISALLEKLGVEGTLEWAQSIITLAECV